jgi:hypothetical protein
MKPTVGWILQMGREKHKLTDNKFSALTGAVFSACKFLKETFFKKFLKETIIF